MTKDLGFLLFLVSCVTVSLCLECISFTAPDTGNGLKDIPATYADKPVNCSAQVKVCKFTYTVALAVKTYRGLCGVSMIDDKKLVDFKDKCEDKTKFGGNGDKIVWCGTDKCNTKELYAQFCGGQSALHSSFIFAFGLIIMGLFSPQYLVST